MRTIIISLFLFISIPAFAQKNTSTNGEANATAQAVLERVDSAGEWMNSTFEKLADKMGVTGEYLWPTFVKEVFVTGVIYVSIGVLSFIFGIAFCLFLLRLRDRLILDWQENRKKEGWPDGACAAQIFALVILFAGFIFLASFSTPGIISMVAPEPEALQNITRAIGQLR